MHGQGHNIILKGKPNEAVGEKILTNNKKKNDKNFTPQRVHSSSTFETRLLVEI